MPENFDRMFLLKVSSYNRLEKETPCASHIFAHIGGPHFLLIRLALLSYGEDPVKAEISDAPIVPCLALTHSACFPRFEESLESLNVRHCHAERGVYTGSYVFFNWGHPGSGLGQTGGTISSM